jgi:hypothetical protein
MLEAMAMSRPIIATKVGDVGEILTDGETGLLIPPREPGEISKAVTSLLSDPERAGQLGRRGRELILERNLTLEKSVRIVEGAYEKVLSADKRGGVMAKVRAGLLFIMFSLLSLTYSLYTSLANSFRSPKSGDNT